MGEMVDRITAAIARSPNEAARAAISEFRVPSPEMMAELEKARFSNERRDVLDLWGAVIDAALR